MGGEVSHPDEPRMLLCVSETNTRTEIDELVAALRAIGEGRIAKALMRSEAEHPERLETSKQ
jgi:hypothetical protein